MCSPVRRGLVAVQGRMSGAYHREMRHVSAALGSSLVPLIGSSNGGSGIVPELPTLGRPWPSLRAGGHTGLADGVDLIDLQPTDTEVARLRPEVMPVRRS